jgi:type IV pilus assembly protein PilA
MKDRQKGFSLIELLIVVAIILIIAAIAIPNLLRSKMAANEASAVASMRTYNTSIISYENLYATTPAALSNLGPASTPSSTSADLVDNLLGSGTVPQKSGYSFTYTQTNSTQYTIVATPVSPSTGQRLFYTDQSGVIRFTTDGSTPNASSSPIGG